MDAPGRFLRLLVGRLLWPLLWTSLWTSLWTALWTFLGRAVTDALATVTTHAKPAEAPPAEAPPTQIAPAASSQPSPESLDGSQSLIGLVRCRDEAIVSGWDPDRDELVTAVGELVDARGWLALCQKHRGQSLTYDGRASVAHRRLTAEYGALMCRRAYHTEPPPDRRAGVRWVSEGYRLDDASERALQTRVGQEMRELIADYARDHPGRL